MYLGCTCCMGVYRVGVRLLVFITAIRLFIVRLVVWVDQTWYHSSIFGLVQIKLTVCMVLYIM